MENVIEAVPEKTVEELKAIFKPFDIRYNREKYKLEYPKGLLRKASVLIPLCFKDGEYSVILTLRSETLTHHAGNVAFPGGMQDDSDADEIQTALREAKEEIGLNEEDVDIIGVFPQSIVSPNSLVSAVLGVVSSDFVPVINQKEVSFVFELPLRRFLSSERRTISNFRSPFDATYHVHYFTDYVTPNEVHTWGFTATLCVLTALGVYQTDHTFCFYEDIISNKEILFDPIATRHVLKQIRLTAKF